jgi:iron complex transport system permease protein
VAGLALMSALALLVFVGRGPGGAWALLSPSLFPDVLPWRLPRLLGAAGAGGLLAVAGYILQRVTANPLASPEVIGVSAGAVLGAALALVLGGSASTLGLTLAATVGSFAALMFVLAISFRAGAMPERVLLAGVALTALVDAVVGVLTAAGDPNSVMLVAWLSGSASSIDLTTASVLFCMGVLFTLATLPGARWLTALPLGSATALSIGVPVVRARVLLLVLAALMTAIATPVIGPLTFVGLMAPHIVALLGVRQVRTGILLSALTGASLMMLADTLARIVAFPLQLPTGILASLLSVPFLLVLISGGGLVSRRTHFR